MQRSILTCCSIVLGSPKLRLGLKNQPNHKEHRKMATRIRIRAKARKARIMRTATRVARRIVKASTGRK
jgi:hypothetical protein